MTKKRTAGEIDCEVLICGGGPAGIAAAWAAAEAGRHTLLVERYGRLGGTATNAMVNQAWMWTSTPFVQKIHERIRKSMNDAEFLDLVYAESLLERGVELLLHAVVADTETLGAEGAACPQLCGVGLMTPSGRVPVKAQCIVDATGDGTVAFLGGASFASGRDPDKLLQPATVMFRVSGVDHAASMEANGGRANYQFAEGGWDHVTMAARERGELPWNVGKVRTYSADRPEDRYVNATQVNYVDGTKIEDLTRAELEGRQQVRAILRFLQSHAPGYANAYVSLMPAVVGIRETRRFDGLYSLTREDCLSGKTWNDTIATQCRAPLDVHNPAGPGQAEGQSEEHPAGRDPEVKPYDIPYRCLVPAQTDGLLLAGRCISGDHYAHSSYRWQTLCMATGAAAGFAAAECLKQQKQPRHIDIAPVQEWLGIRPVPGADELASNHRKP